MNLSYEGQIALMGGILFVIGLPFLLFGDHFDASKLPTRAGMLAWLITGLGFLGLAVALVLIGGRVLWQTLVAIWQALAL
ncbi:hypothetical protein [uncultured Hyphomicrobium sp.]|uniref:hypothetical protein n=1 Tax=uncultured Hyphomicrobium sp. TaxID=194373 RepID=UPI0025FF4D7D|nr:hypothetical protein [uncultured Hyphomicrobium sp.]